MTFRPINSYCIQVLLTGSVYYYNSLQSRGKMTIICSCYNLEWSVDTIQLEIKVCKNLMLSICWFRPCSLPGFNQQQVSSVWGESFGIISIWNFEHTNCTKETYPTCIDGQLYVYYDCLLFYCTKLMYGTLVIALEENQLSERYSGKRSAAGYATLYLGNGITAHITLFFR